MEGRWPEQSTGGAFQLPESPREPMEFLSRSWSASALKLSKTVAPPTPSFLHKTAHLAGNPVQEEISGEADESAVLSGNTFSFACSATSQLVLERIMSQSGGSPTAVDLSMLASQKKLSPPVSPSEEFDDVVKFLRANNTLQPLFATSRNGYGTGGNNTPGGKTVGRWLKERREKKKEETRAHNAQLHAVVSVAGVAAAVATIAAATATASASGKDEQMAKTDMAVASAATLVAAQCVEAAEAMGAERDHLIAAVNSAVNVRSHGDILTLNAAAATALRGAATLKARALKEVWNIAAVIPVDKRLGTGDGHNKSNNGQSNTNSCNNEGLPLEENFLGACNQELLARGSLLLKRTRTGDLHWKIVSVYIHRTGQVMLKMKSKYAATTITKKKKNVVIEVCKSMPAWPGRHLFEGGEQRCYFGLKTARRGVVEFECKSRREYDMWTRGVARLLTIVAESRCNRRN
ncbi:hypothetical protein RJ639_020649 [Escallonia herrerae]|uniref:VAN3-binding protein n=1 Tax=Escallonia herrerae TaxID=1293975 RepID=A0AA88V6T5_9ASTE|nr:hypothetical protein RJ639_020649 [Escallonia herrerae]